MKINGDPALKNEYVILGVCVYIGSPKGYLSQIASDNFVGMPWKNVNHGRIVLLLCFIVDMI